jgi:integrase
MPTRSLTAAAVTRIKPPKTGQEDHFDRGFPGLALRVSYGGARTWIFFYRLHGKLRRLSLGRFPAMGLTEPREAWRAARLAVSKGESPAHLKPTTADTFGAVADEWLARDQAQNRSAAEVRRVIERDVKPAWGDRLVGAITRRDVIELIDGVADRGATTMARRLHSHLHRLFRWAVGRGIVEASPMADLPKPGQAVQRNRVLDNSELAAVWKAAGKIGGPFGPAVRLLILTAARREEIGSLSWSEVHDSEIRLPGERSKSGEPRIIPLSPSAAKLLGDLPRTGDRVFSTNGTTSISGWGKAKRTLDATAAEINGAPLGAWRIHDLRRTVATGLQRLGTGLQTVEAILGHVAGSRAGVVGIYQRHQFEDEKRVALEAWAREVERITGSSTTDSSTTDTSTAGSSTAGSSTAGSSTAGSSTAGSSTAGSSTAGSYVITPPATTLTLLPSAPTVERINVLWLEAIKQADKTSSFEPVHKFLDQPQAELGPADCFWLQKLLERLQFKRKKSGHFVPLGQRSRQEIHEIGAAHVRKLQRDEGLPQQKAIDRVVKIYPKEWFGPNGESLSNYMRRGARKF